MKNSLGLQLESAQRNFPNFRRGEGKGENLHRKRGCKGFTLVELIVVIVILAILAAILVPGLLGWIDKAKTKRYEMEARNIYLAAEASFVEGYAWGFEGSDNKNIIGFRGKGEYTIEDKDPNKNWFAYISEMSGIDSIEWVKIYVNDGKIKALNVNYKSPSDNKRIKAYIKEPGYIHEDSNTEFQKWFGTGKADDGLWHFHDLANDKPIP